MHQPCVLDVRIYPVCVCAVCGIYAVRFLCEMLGGSNKL